MLIPIRIPDFSVMHPKISESAMSIHYHQHYLKYVDKTNQLIKDTVFDKLELEDIIKISRMSGGLYQNAAQVWNHEFFFEQFSDKRIVIPNDIERFIQETFGGTFETLINASIKESLKLFGSGYLWIYYHKGRLNVKATPNSENLLKYRLKSIICIDLWEHAYYLNYQSDRANYIKDIFNIIDWNVISKRIENATI